jgi:putative acetyltransferase
MATIRAERNEDIPAIRRINELAFAASLEANLMDKLRKRGKLFLSLVAEEDAQIVGHIAFSPVIIETHPDLLGFGLGPMAVLPTLQKKGLGSQLVRAGLERCRELECDYGVVLGHSEYYPRFGFMPASRFRLKCSWEVPDNVFMAIELRPGALSDVSGLVSYEPELSKV